MQNNKKYKFITMFIALNKTGFSLLAALFICEVSLCSNVRKHMQRSLVQ